jgi:hypothetical protein
LEGATINKSQNITEKGYYNLYDKKGLQLMVSNHVRIRKQYGVVAFLFILLNYTWGVFFFFIAHLFHCLFTLTNPAAGVRRVALFFKNVVRLWMLCPIIISNKKYFYKMF